MNNTGVIMKNKKMKRRLLGSLLAVAMLAPSTGNVLAAVEPADWNYQTAVEDKTDAWALGVNNRVKRVPQRSGLKSPSINYAGVYKNGEGRQVVRLTFNSFQNAIYGWTNLVIKLPKSFVDMVDWQSQKTGMYGLQYNGMSHDFKNDTRSIIPFEKLSKSETGSDNTFLQSLTNNGNYIGAHSVASTPMDFVLKEGKSIKDLNEQVLIQARFMDSKLEEVFGVASEAVKVGSYNSYTFTTILPSKDMNFHKGLNKNIFEVPGPFYGTSSYITYNLNGGYIDVIQNQSKQATGDEIGYGLRNQSNPIAYRQVFDKTFLDVLDEKAKNGVVAEVTILDKDDLPYGSVAPVKIMKNDFSEDGDLAFLQLAGSNWNTDTDATGVKTKIVSESARNIILNGTTTEFNSGVATRFRYYIRKEALENIIKGQGLKSYAFYSVVLNGDKQGTINFSTKTQNEIKLQKGEKINLNFNDNQGYASAGSYFETRKVMTIGNDQFSFDFIDSIQPQGSLVTINRNAAKTFIWTVPFDMIIPAGTPISVRGVYNNKTSSTQTLSMTRQNKANAETLLTFSNPTVEHKPRTIKAAENITGGTMISTIYKPYVNEVFTTDENVSGASNYDRAEMTIAVPELENGQSTLRKDQHFSAAKDTSDVVIKSQVTSNNTTEEKYVTYKGHEFDTTRPNIAGEDQLKQYKAVSIPKFEKDMPIYLSNRAVLSASLAGKDVIEQVQAKVKFDLGDQTSKIDGNKYIDRIAPLNKEYLYKLEEKQDPTNQDKVIGTFTKNTAYKPSGFATIDKDGNPKGIENLRVAEDNKVVEISQEFKDSDGVKTELKRKVINYLDHNGEAYNINTTDKDNKLDQLNKLIKRQFPINDEVNLPNAKRIIGWTTVKLEDKKVDGKEVTASDQYYELLESKDQSGNKNKIVRDVKDWKKAESEAYIFDEQSPVDKERTVYAVYGGISIVLHSGVKDANGNEIIVRVPVSQEDINTTKNKMAGIDESEIKNRIKSQIIKELPKAPYSENDKTGADERLKDFVKANETFLGWSIEENNNSFKAGNNNNRISELDLGHDVEKNPLIKSTEWIDFIRNNPEKAYLPNGFNLGFDAKDFGEDGKLLTEKNKTGSFTSVDDILENVSEIHLYAMYRPYYDITVDPGYFTEKAADQDHNVGKLERGLEDKTKQKPLLIGLMMRTAVTGYDVPTVDAAANYYPIIDRKVADENIDNLPEDQLIEKLKLKKWNPNQANSQQDLTWKEPGFDVLGRRRSYVALVITDKNKDAYKEFAKPFSGQSWSNVGMSTFLKLGGQSLDPNAPKNLYDDPSDPYKAHRDGYGKPLAKIQNFQTEYKDASGQKTIDAFTSATARASIVDQNTKEVTGYNVVITNVLANLPAPVFERVVDTHKVVKMVWDDTDKYNEITDIEIYAYEKSSDKDPKTFKLTKQSKGKFEGSGIIAEFKEGKLQIKAQKPENGQTPSGVLPLVAGKDLAAKYFKKTGATIDKQSNIGNTRIIGDKLSEPVREMKQGVKAKPSDKAYIEFKVPEKVLDKVGPNSVYIAEKWDPASQTWLRVGQRVLTSEDTVNDQLEGNVYNIDLQEYTGTAGEADFINGEIFNTDGSTVQGKIYKVKHEDIIRIVSVESNKDNDIVDPQGNKKLGYSAPAYSAGRDKVDGKYKDNDRAIITSPDSNGFFEKENRNYIKLDLTGPKTSAKATDSAYRRFIDIKAQLDELPQGSDVKLIVKLSDGSQIEKVFSAKEVNGGVVANYINQLYRQDDGITMTLQAVDSYGNPAYLDENTKEINVQYEKTKQLQLQITDVRPRRKAVSVRSSEENTQIQLRVVNKDGQEVATGQENSTAANTFVSVGLKTTGGTKDYRIKKGDIIYFIGYKLDGSNNTMENFRSNLGQIEVK